MPTTPAVSSPAFPTPSKAPVTAPALTNSSSTLETLNSPSSNQGKPARKQTRDDDDDFDEDD